MGYCSPNVCVRPLGIGVNLNPAMASLEDKYLRLRDENTALKKENNELRVVIKRCVGL